MTLLQEGGPVFMYPLLLLLILVLVLLVKGFLKKETTSKTIKLVSSITLFALVWGFLGQIIGLITAFDVIEANSGVSSKMLAAGLKISFLTPAFGALVFLVGRLGIIVLTWLQKD
jgi:hypothetical protein